MEDTNLGLHECGLVTHLVINNLHVKWIDKSTDQLCKLLLNLMGRDAIWQT